MTQPVGTVDDFETFVARHGRALLTTAALLTHDQQRAEDLVQVALLATWRSWSRIHRDPVAFSRKVLFNSYISWWRRPSNRERPSDELPEAFSTGSDQAAHLDLRAAVARLPRRQRAVIVLRYYEDLTEAETAALLGCAVGTVKSQSSRALHKLGIDPALTDAHSEVGR